MSSRSTPEIVADLRSCVDASDASHDTSMWLLSEAADRLADRVSTLPLGLNIYDDIDRERQRAHAKHGASSIEGRPPADSGRLAILVEEVGEVARNLNDRRHADTTYELLDFDALLRAELIQVAAMAVGWIATIDRTQEQLGIGTAT